MVEELIGADEQASRDILGMGFGAAVEFARMLASEGELRGLIGPKEVPRLWRRHIMNSTAVAPFLPASGVVADVGSGAGFPGIVLAMIRPDLEFELIEPMERRVQWLNEVQELLDLDNISIVHQRAEELHKKKCYSAVTARAVAAMDKLLRVTGPLIADDGSLYALKGQRVYDEIEAARYVFKRTKLSLVAVHEVDVFGDNELTYVAEVARTQ